MTILFLKQICMPKNYGRIYIRSVYQTYQIDVTAECVPADKALYKEKKTQFRYKKCRADITKLYEAYRLKKIVTEYGQMKRQVYLII